MYDHLVCVCWECNTLNCQYTVMDMVRLKIKDFWNGCPDITAINVFHSVSSLEKCTHVFFFVTFSSTFLHMKKHILFAHVQLKIYQIHTVHISQMLHYLAALCFISIHHDFHQCVLYSDSYSMMCFFLILTAYLVTDLKFYPQSLSGFWSENKWVT